MNEPITVGVVVWFILVVVGLFGLGAACLFLLSLLNPFRTGH